VDFVLCISVLFWIWGKYGCTKVGLRIKGKLGQHLADELQGDV